MMKVCGRSLSDHLRLLAPLFALVAIVWALRWIFDEAGFPHGLVRAFSVTGATSLAILIAVWLIHRRGFGSYPNVVAASLLLVVFSQLIIVLAILFSVIGKNENVFTEPEFSIVGDDPYHVRHIVGHLTFGIGAGMLFGAAMGCLMLWLLRTLVPMEARQ
jgi:hypothetical protein